MSRREQIEAKLRAAFAPIEIMVRDDSESHRGHAGFQEGGESHFYVLLRSAAFENLTRIKRHRAVHDALGKDLIGQIHALQLDLGT